MFKNCYDIILFLLPMIVGYATSFFCKIGRTAGAAVNSRPPSYVFMIIWPILYLLMGLSWVNANNDLMNNQLTVNVLYGLLTFTLALWTYFYGCQNNKKYALWTLPMSILLILIILMYTPNYLLLPLLVWLLFAMLLNFEEVNKDGESFAIFLAPQI